MARRTKAQILAAKAEEAKMRKAAEFETTNMTRRAATTDGRIKTKTDNHQYPTFPHSGPKTTLGQIGRAFEDIDNRIDGVQEGGLNPGSITADKLKTDTPEALKAFQDALEVATIDDLDAEAAEREAGDKTNADAIAAEAKARKSADDALDKRVDAEKQYRADGDAKLQKVIDAEAKTREEADAAEVAARTEAVNAVQEALNAEVTARTDADTALDQKIADEREARSAADTKLQEDLEAEATAREEADTNLQGAVDAEKTAREEADSQLTSTVEANKQAADEAIAAETEARTQAVADLTETVTNNKTAADAAIATLTQNLSTESSERAKADLELTSTLQGEIGDREAADTALGGRIDQEISDRTAADALKADKTYVDGELAKKLNADANAVSATKLETARNINLTGDVTGTATFDGTADADITVTLVNAGTTGRQLLKAETAGDANDVLGLLSVLDYKGTVDTEASLPEDAALGDVYNVTDTGMNYAWNGTQWDALGAVTTLATLGLTATADELNYTDGVTAPIQTQLDAKQTKDDADAFETLVGETYATKTEMTDGLALKQDAATAFDGKYTSLTEVPSEFTPKAHTHEIADVNGLQTALDGKVDDAEIADMETRTHAAETYQVKGDYAVKADVNEALDLKADKTEIGDMLTKTEAASTYQAAGDYATKGELAAKADATAIADMLTKTEAADIYQSKGDYATTAQIADMETKTEAAESFATIDHGHDISGIDGLQEALDSKADKTAIADMETKTEAASTYATKGELAAKQDAATAFDGKYTSLTEIPSQFTPAAHTHVMADVTDLQGALDAKADTSAIPTIPGNATTSQAGLMSAEDKTKLDGLNNYVLPEATADVLGGVKVGTGLTVQDGKLTISNNSKTFANPEVIGSGETLDLSTATNGVYSIAGGSITGLTGSNDSAAVLVINAGAVHTSALAFDGAFATDKVLPVSQDGTTWFKLTAMDRAEFVADPAGDTVTKEEFIALRDALVTAGIMKPKA